MSKSKDKTNMNDLFAGVESEAAKLAIIGGLITTLGDGLTTLAAILALEETQQSNSSNDNNNDNNDSNTKKLEALEKQVQYLTKELNKLKYAKR
ncbi:translation initiation factor 2 [Lysinibacillus sp. NPDC097195]|uniref:translation initiation factor 2 n=1 Tax=Lysinibacillus sp. NPDC097195 TaxID=3364141 RepID=UPI00381D1E79